MLMNSTPPLKGIQEKSPPSNPCELCTTERHTEKRENSEIHANHVNHVIHVLSATFASSQSSKNKAILPPEPNAPIIRNASLPTLCSWDLVVDAIPLCDHGSSALFTLSQDRQACRGMPQNSCTFDSYKHSSHRSLALLVPAGCHQ